MTDASCKTMPNGYILSEYRNKKQNCDLPSTSGVKDYCPNPGDFAQAKRLQRLQEVRDSLVSELRVAKRKQLPSGSIRKNLVEIETLQGAYWRFVGFSEGKKRFLRAEEAVYLMECSVLEVRHRGLPLSGERLYSWMLRDVRLEEFLTYTHLMRLGYVVRRYEGESNLSQYERTLNLHQYSGKRKHSVKTYKDKKTKLDSGIRENSKIRSEQSNLNKSCESIQCNSCEEVSSLNPNDEENLNSECKIHEKEECVAEMMLDLKENSNVDQVSLSELYCYTVDNVVDFLRQDLWSLSLGSSVDKDASVEWPNSLRTADRNEGRAFTLNEPLSEASNWQEYKTLREKLTREFVPPTKYLWDDEIQPLNSPQSFKNASEIQENLKIVKSVSDLKLPKMEPKFTISYDLYTPAQKSAFKKSGTILPAYRIVVMTNESKPPELADVVRMKCNDGVPLLWAVADNGNVQFYTFEHVEIPDDLKK